MSRPVFCLARILAPHFVAGVVIENGVVVRCAPIVSYMKGWKGYAALDYCARRGWAVEIMEERDAIRDGGGDLGKA
jgi:hypothetical protein